MKKLLKKTLPLLLFFSLLLQVSASAAVSSKYTSYSSTRSYYVSTTGKDSASGTLCRPFRTIQKAASVASAGDTIYIRGGVYRERVTAKRSGTEGNVITYRNYPGERVTLDGATVSLPYYYPLFDLASHSYITVQGLRIINSAGQGIGDVWSQYDNGNITIKDVETYRTSISGIHFYNAHDIVIDNCTIDTANLTADQESLTLAGVNGFEIKNSRVFNAQKEAIDVKDGSHNGRIVNNTVTNARKGSGLAIYVDGARKGASNIEISGNTVLNAIQGIVVASELGGSVSNIRILNNQISDSTHGVQIAGWGHINGGAHPMKDIRIVGNHVSGLMGIDLILSNPDAKTVTITDNHFGGTSSTVPLLVLNNVNRADYYMARNYMINQ